MLGGFVEPGFDVLNGTVRIDGRAGVALVARAQLGDDLFPGPRWDGAIVSIANRRKQRGRPLFA